MRCLRVARYWPSILLDLVDGLLLETRFGVEQSPLSDKPVQNSGSLAVPMPPTTSWQLDRGSGISRRMLTNDPPSTNLSSEKIVFGVMPTGSKVEKYTLKNGRPMEVSILSYGGIIQSIVVPDQSGELADITLGFDQLEDYLKPNPFFGAIIGRYGNRIAQGRFTLNGRAYQIPINDGVNALHGG